MRALVRIAGGGLTPRGDLDALGETLIGMEEFVQIRRLFSIKGTVRRRSKWPG